MSDITYNKFRAAAEVLQRGRDQMVESMAEDVLDQAEDLLENGFLFNEFLETQGTRLHFLSVVLSQLDQSADSFDEQAMTFRPPVVSKAEPKKRKPRSKKLHTKASAEGSSDDL